MFRSNSETCPGIKKFVRPVPEYFQCPNCGGEVEIWSDEDTGICDTCNKEVGRPEKEQSCLNWCEYAAQCREIIKRMKR
jgi:predicted amidophosphoribosyltransferase